MKKRKLIRNIRNKCPKQYIFSRVVVDKNDCWIWTRSKKYDGYANAFFNRKKISGHRLSYKTFKGEISDGLVIDHLCRNPACLNPEHLEAVTSLENLRRGFGPAVKNRAKTHCIRGHAFKGRNIIWEQGKYRHCRACKYKREYARMKRVRKAKAIERALRLMGEGK